MKKLIVLIAVVIPGLAFSQVGGPIPVLPFTDSLRINLEFPEDDVVLLADTVTPNFTSVPYDMEYVPADETPEVLTERLNLLQNQIPLVYNEKVHGFINYFLIRDREHTRNVMRKSDIYFPIFERHLKENNMPDELKYLSVIESALVPKAVSRARAVGLWQFMSYTGRYCGLKIDWYIDERMDPEKSTAAACKYLSQLYTIFHDWELALAAYNTGPGNVKRAIRKSGGKKTFWEIYPYLPRETRAYLPQYVAMVYALNHSSDHNLFVDGREELLRNDTLAVNGYLHLETLASMTGSCLDDFRKLNPSILHDVLPDGREHIIRIPLSAKLELDKNRVAILDSAMNANKVKVQALAHNAAGNTLGREMTVYRVKSGDVLGVIARRYGVRVEDMKKWNNLSSNMIRSGQRLNIWLMPGQQERQPVASAAPATNSVTNQSGSKTYTVQPGDTLWDITKKFQGLTVEKIKSLNNLKSNELKPGQKLIIS
ncbi:MAG TPA: LysM peptidoglycan-binding domain-containing protein [Cyclobacteriaceae bacterium]|nr:LysM peptidoglycan-binding domain-containing protein [Cyclobacteriaceae bacterium]